MSYDVAVVGDGCSDGTTSMGELSTAVSEAATCVGATMREVVATFAVIIVDTAFEKYNKEIVAFMASVRSFQKYEYCDWLERRKKHDHAAMLKKSLVFLRPIFFRRVMFSAAGYLPWRVRRKRKNG